MAVQNRDEGPATKHTQKQKNCLFWSYISGQERVQGPGKNNKITNNLFVSFKVEIYLSDSSGAPKQKHLMTRYNQKGQEGIAESANNEKRPTIIVPAFLQNRKAFADEIWWRDPSP